jgi:hydrogenase maturation protein HypF
VATGRARLRLHCRGLVQGVGFRPCVHHLAQELGLTGRVENLAGTVLVELDGPRRDLQLFLERLPRRLPDPARLEPLLPHWLPAGPPGDGAPAPGVTITAGAPWPLGIGWVAPALVADRAPCGDCLRELADPGDRRHRYPFISCSVCGPRYSIATAEPYARAHTTLAGFPLCLACQREFDDPANRRFHAETISCPDCGPRLWFQPSGGQPLGGRPFGGRPQGDAMATACDLLASGGVLGLQGVGGFQLLVDATNPQAVGRLRQRKRRPAKPYALLVAEVSWITPWCRIDGAELAAMNSAAAPIVLLRRSAGDPFPLVAPGSPCLGVMLPASPLHHLLVGSLGRPLVATSGNRSGEPLCTDPQEAIERLGMIADGFLFHDRPIARPLDDSVLQLVEGRPAMIRRARGFAPEPLQLPSGAEVALAVGGDLKCAPALALGSQVWMAPYLGDLAQGRLDERLARGLEELLHRHGEHLAAIACDAHPGYLSHQLAHGQSIPAHPVQHHLAHGLAVMAEHGLEPPMLAVGFDGLGYGPPPGQRLWGGEWLLVGLTGWRRLACLRPFPLPGGERAMGEPRRVALGLLVAAGLEDHPGASHTLSAFRDGERDLLCRAITAGCNCPASSSAGRLFDAVASLLGLCQRLSFEGQGGLLVEGAAASEADERFAYPLPLAWGDAEPGMLGHIDWQPMLASLLDDIAAGVPRSRCAARFHNGLALAVGDVAALAGDPHGVPPGGGPWRRVLSEPTFAGGLHRQPEGPPTGSPLVGAGSLQRRRTGSRTAVGDEAPGSGVAMSPPDPGQASIGHVEQPLGRLRQVVGPLVHLPLLPGFHHHPQQGLGATGPHQHPALTLHLPLRLLHRQSQGLALVPVLPPLTVGHDHIDQLLGIGPEASIHPLGQALATGMDQGGHLQSGEQAIAAHAVKGRKDMSRLFPPQSGPEFFHGGVDVLIPHRRPFQTPPMACQASSKPRLDITVATIRSSGRWPVSRRAEPHR